MGFIVCAFILLVVLVMLGFEGLIAAMVLGAIGYVVGGFAGEGWAIYGAILGALVAASAVFKNKT